MLVNVSVVFLFFYSASEKVSQQVLAVLQVSSSDADVLVEVLKQEMDSEVMIVC